VEEEKQDRRQFIKVYEEFMKEEEYDSRDHFVYLLIKGFANQRFDGISIASVDSLLRILGFVVNSKNKAGIKESIEKLVRNRMIKMYADFMCTQEEQEVKYANTYFFKILDAPYKGDYFTKIFYEDFYKLISMEEKNKMKVFSIYYNIISRMFANASSDKFTLPNIEDIEQETGINRKTITKYIKLLMDNELVYYESMRKAIDKTKNVYGRWEHRDIVKKFAEENLDY
jgi:hypothetical protein